MAFRLFLNECKITDQLKERIISPLTGINRTKIHCLNNNNKKTSDFERLKIKDLHVSYECFILK